MHGKALGQIVGEVGKGWPENRRNRFRKALRVRSAIGAQGSKATYLNIAEREDDRLKFKMNARFEPVFPRDGDPFVIGKKSVCRPEAVWCGESEVCGLTDGGEDIEVGKGRKDEDEDNCFYGSERSAHREGSRNGTHCFGDLVGTISMRILSNAER